MARKGESKWTFLLEDVDVKRWYRNLARGSPGYAINVLGVLGRFLSWAQVTPAGYVKLPTKKRDDLLDDFIEEMVQGLAPDRRRRAGSYVKNYKKAVASWLQFNGEEMGRAIKVPGTNERPTLRDKHIPTQEELRRVFHNAKPQAKAAIALIAFSGLRPEVLGAYLGNDGLRLGDIEGVKTRGGEVGFEEVPARIVVPDQLSKTRRSYFTFVGPEGCDYLAAYFRERIEVGEKLTKQRPVITPKDGNKEFIRTINIGDMVRKPMRVAGLREPPYIWRSYFASRAMLAEGKGFTRDFREFCMGHSGGIAHVYALHKQLPPDTIERMRRGYEASLEFLETVNMGPREDPTVRMLSLLLQAAGYDAHDIDAMDLGDKTEEEVVEIIRKIGGSVAANGNGGGQLQRIIPLGELDGALAGGWVFKAPLPDGRVVVEALGIPLGLTAGAQREDQADEDF